MRHTQTPRDNLKLVKDTFAITGSVPGQSHKIVSVLQNATCSFRTSSEVNLSESKEQGGHK